MRTWIYRSSENPDKGLIIQEEKNGFTIWIDNYEGGEAYVTEWEYLTDTDTLSKAHKWLTDNYGEIKKIRQEETWVYKSVSIPDVGFIVQKESDGFTIWIDNYESGEAYITDWEFLNKSKTFSQAYKWLLDNYGKVKKKHL